MPADTLSRARAAESRLIQQIYQACDLSIPWTAFMRELVAALDSRSARLLLMNRAADEVHESYVINHDDFYIKQYIDYYVNQCPWRTELSSKPKGVVYSSYLDFSCKQTAFRRSEFYNDWAKPQNIEHGICGTIYRQRDTAVQLLVQRTREAGHFSRAETDFVNQLVPHIHNAIELRQNIESMHAVERGVAALADRYSQPFALLDERLNVCFISRHMQDAIDRSAGLKLSGERLSAKHPDENAKLYRLLQESCKTASGKGNSSGGVVTIAADYSDALRLHIMPYPLELDSRFMFPKRTFAVVFATSNSLNFSVATGHIATQYDLTERESQLAAMLCRGLSVDQIAERDGVKTGTLRKQLKSIYIKTGTHRQGELIVKLLNSLASQRP